MHMTAKNLIDPFSLDSTLEVASLELRFVNHQPYYWVNREKLFNAQTGAEKGEITEEEARKIAKTYIKGDYEIESTEYLTETGSHHEYRGRPLPAWAIHFNHPEKLTAYIDIEETTIPKGKYAFFTIPRQEEWTLILNKNWEQHLADDYYQADDVIRIEVTAEKEMPLTERLTYTIEDKGEGSGAIRMSWEKLSISLPFKTD
ncbi:hypothetical protein GHT06_003977 [Daphnia sinensis]|uniref:DUF2911 domain-containing protein n=1 Tax=Daphnia sinensis TaxID=1820382 RepID=A0AAD5PM62_9CRUS|nr:hypothetical protein GHT06_003977 [Daphnia sinensis]